MDVGIAEAKDRLSELVDRVERGEPVTITRHGKPVANITPVRTRPTRAELERLFREVEEDKKGYPPISRDDIVEAIRSGRRM